MEAAVWIPLVGIVVALWGILQPLVSAWAAYQVVQLRKRLDASDADRARGQAQIKASVESVGATVQSVGEDVKATVKEHGGNGQ